MSLDFIWDVAMAASKEAIRRQERREIREDLSRVGTRCGDCAHWMTRQCPKETNVNGRKLGPSAGTPICPMFSLSGLAANRRDDWAARLEAIR